VFVPYDAHPSLFLAGRGQSSEKQLILSPLFLRPRKQRLPRSSVALAAALAFFASLIVADFLMLSAEFHAKRFALLWCGSRHGFATFTADATDGRMFGVFRLVGWKSWLWNGGSKAKGNSSGICR
jgi:hypothetical protein